MSTNEAAIRSALEQLTRTEKALRAVAASLPSALSGGMWDYMEIRDGKIVLNDQAYLLGEEVPS